MTAEMQTQDSVRHFRQIMLWPLQIPLTEEAGAIDYRSVLQSASGHPWQTVEERRLGTGGPFSEALYAEFVSFLP